MIDASPANEGARRRRVSARSEETMIVPAINTRHLPCFKNYAQARAYYDKTKPIRGSVNKRPLGDRKRHNTTMITLDPSTEDVSCHLYGSPLVVFHKNNNITVNSWASMSSNAFSRAVLPPGLNVTCNGDVNCLHIWPCWEHGEIKYREAGRYFKFGECIRLLPRDPASGYAWEPDAATTTTWRLTRVDKSLAKAMLARYNYGAFRVYLLTRLSISDTIGPDNHDAPDPLECLLDRAKWKLLINTWDFSVSRRLDWAKGFLEEIRGMIYRKHNCFTTVECDYLTKIADVVWSYMGPWDNR